MRQILFWPFKSTGGELFIINPIKLMKFLSWTNIFVIKGQMYKGTRMYKLLLPYEQ